MKNITQKDVEYVARLARIRLKDEEKSQFTGQLENILGYIGKLKEKNTDNIEPTAHPLDATNALRKDEAKPFNNIDGIFKNAPDTEETYFKVKKVIE